MRAAGSPGTCGPGYRAKPTGVTGIPAKPPDVPSGLSEGSRALPVPRTERTATKEQPVTPEPTATVTVDVTTEVGG